MLLLGLHVGLGNWAVARKSVTFDEVLHLASGYAYWEFGDFRLQPTNGNFPQRWATLPLWIADVKYPTRDQEEWYQSGYLGLEIGRQMLYKIGNDPDLLLAASRFMISLLSAALGLLIYDWSRRLFGKIGGLYSLALYAVSPIFLAHGFLATSDVAAAACYLAATGSLWSVLHQVSVGRLAAMFSSVGLLAVAKMSAPLLAPMAVLMVAARVGYGRPWLIDLGGRRRLVRGRIAQTMLAAGLGAYVFVAAFFTIWAFHHFRYEAMVDAVAGRDDFSVSWPDVLDGIGRSQRVFEWCREMRVLPEAYLYGLAHTIKFSQERDAFLLGMYSMTGWWYFFPYCFLAKTATFEWLAGLVSGATLIYAATKASPRMSKRGLYYAVPLAALWCVYWGAAVTSNLNIGNRHLLPIYGPWYIGCGALAWLLYARHAMVRRLGAVLVCACFADAAHAYPHYLAYFNAWVGGPDRGYRQMIDSSLDWGQDLKELGQWSVEERKAGRLRGRLFYDYFGLADAGYHKVQGEEFPLFYAAELDPKRPVSIAPGTYAVSATYLVNKGHWIVQLEPYYQKLLKSIEILSRTHPWTSQLPPDAYPPEIAEQWRIYLYQLLDYQTFRLYYHLLNDRTPRTTVGHSILVYDVSQEELDRWLLD
ncbi:MAG: hypothetical protein C0483_00975 [Pirellula sp.]|nr:hypothetical protein [Pirellula sp.]